MNRGRRRTGGSGDCADAPLVEALTEFVGNYRFNPR